MSTSAANQTEWKVTEGSTKQVTPFSNLWPYILETVQDGEILIERITYVTYGHLQQCQCLWPQQLLLLRNHVCAADARSIFDT